MEMGIGESFRTTRELLKRFDTGLVFAFLLPISLWIGCSRFAASGPLWPDGPQYANAAAMIHDWLQSGSLLHPYEFAKQNYARMPAFHIPYHPPFYPALLALFFSITGVSYFSARLFVALCLWLSGCFFYLILTRCRVRQSVAVACSLLLITFPEVALWSRDSMSEVPALWLILAATYCFIVWLETDRKSAYWAAFGLAGAAFFSRFLTAGVLPAWFVWALLAGKRRKLMAPWALVPPILFGVAGGLWTKAAVRFSRYETTYAGTRPTTNWASVGSFKIVAYYAAHLPSIIGWPALIAAVLGALCLLFVRGKDWRDFMWLPWIVSYVVFVEVIGIYQEQRYFMYALPAIAGIIANLQLPSRYLFPAAAGICLLWNVARIPALPLGAVGLEPVARELALARDRGNILVATIGQSDLIFRYRSQPGAPARTFIRGDRTLVIRPPSYSSAEVKVIARTGDDVLDIIRRGRVRYLVTCSHAAAAAYVGTPEMALLDEIAGRRPDLFQPMGAYPLSISYLKGGAASVRIWKFTGEVPAGDSELGVVVPTADFTISPAR
jgi:hypothetical protein